MKTRPASFTRLRPPGRQGGRIAERVSFFGLLPCGAGRTLGDSRVARSPNQRGYEAVRESARSKTSAGESAQYRILFGLELAGQSSGSVTMGLWPTNVHETQDTRRKPRWWGNRPARLSPSVLSIPVFQRVPPGGSPGPTCPSEKVCSIGRKRLRRIATEALAASAAGSFWPASAFPYSSGCIRTAV
jgi:hypothetical protein